jgi:ADP-ribosylglycohydrolase
MDSLVNGFNDYDMMTKFLKWLDGGAYTARGGVFDVGIATRNAITRFSVGKPPFDCGCASEYDNGNGSLMRILPIIFYLDALYGRTHILCEESLSIVHNISALTHAHPRSQMACGIFIAVASKLLNQMPIEEAFTEGVKEIMTLYSNMPEFASESHHYERLLALDFIDLEESQIRSSGYVVDTLEAAFWCLLNTTDYKTCVLKAVNLGGDTDTVAAVAGGLAGLIYGKEAIPEEWLLKIANRELIDDISTRFQESLVHEEAQAQTSAS